MKFNFVILRLIIFNKVVNDFLKNNGLEKWLKLLIVVFCNSMLVDSSLF